MHGHMHEALDARQGAASDQFGIAGAGVKRRHSEERMDRKHTVRASHLLVKHRDSRRPSSWKEPTVTRTKVLTAAKGTPEALRKPLPRKASGLW